MLCVNLTVFISNKTELNNKKEDDFKSSSFLYIKDFTLLRTIHNFSPTGVYELD